MKTQGDQHRSERARNRATWRWSCDAHNQHDQHQRPKQDAPSMRSQAPRKPTPTYPMQPRHNMGCASGTHMRPLAMIPQTSAGPSRRIPLPTTIAPTRISMALPPPRIQQTQRRIGKSRRATARGASHGHRIERHFPQPRTKGAKQRPEAGTQSNTRTTKQSHRKQVTRKLASPRPATSL